ncbi:superoxide dismutase [Bacillus luteolus]|uniref:superoxide dismutase n=1 Tax=Litchfieldia luteola TaxID=682179 RepID=A0ABR9QPA8_9BACI|nr:superoxide dismutase [Cytobacillus luteolus]MBP1942085.1 Fe-Mn family superoxide dismutase [Cytobacillus luteolus]
MTETIYFNYVQEVIHWGKGILEFIEDQRGEENNYEEIREKLKGLLSELEIIDVSNHLSKEFIESLQTEVDKLFLELNGSTDPSITNEERQSSGRVEIGGHRLPPLPYEYNALEPYIAEEIMKLHHQKHHQSYVDGLNKAEKMMANARKTGDFDLIKHWEREAAFHGSGHYLHTIFWNIMKPDGGGQPSGSLLRQINMDFGSFANFKKHFTEAANKVEGVGWAILVWAPRAHRLEILQSERHQLMTQWDTIPLLVLDVWEHAYYLQYKNNRKEYVDNWWNVVNWNEVEKRFNAASNLRWQPY